MSDNFYKNINQYLSAIIGVLFAILVGIMSFLYAGIANRVEALEEKGPDVIVAQKDIESIKDALQRIEKRMDTFSQALNVK